MKICLVCLGNICRSPMAEVVLRAKLAEVGLDAEVDSAGCNTGHAGQPMHAQALAALARRGYDGSAFRARQFYAFWDHDLILVMDNSNLEDLREMGIDSYLFGEFGGLGTMRIPDPFFGDADDFDYALYLIESAMPVVISRISDMIQNVNTASEQLASLVSRVDAALATVNPDIINQAAGMLLDCRRTGRTVFLCGNGGSAGLANHAACDLGIAGVRAMSLCVSSEVITAAGNDYGFDNVFASQLGRLSRDGDMLLAISSSGRSPDIIRALEYAADHGMRTITLTGFPGSSAHEKADAPIHFEAQPRDYGTVEASHQIILHALADYVKAKWSAASEASA